jgi:hypothetical protein
MLQNLKGPHPLKSDYSGEVVGLRNLHSYAVRVQPSGLVTVRNRASLRKIPKPVTMNIPVVDAEVARPEGRVTRSGKSLVTERSVDSVGSAGIPGQSQGAGQDQGSGEALMKQLPGQTGQEYREAVCENFMGQIFPGVLQKSPVSGQKSMNDDSGPSREQRAESREQPAAVLPGQGASLGGLSPGVGLTLGQSGRLASEDSSDSNNLAVQVLAGGQLRQAAAGPGSREEVSPGASRRSARQGIKSSFYQAGSAGMEATSRV